MLVLPTPIVRLDLDELGERILQAPRDRDRAADRQIELREFFAREIRRAVHDAPARHCSGH